MGSCGRRGILLIGLSLLLLLLLLLFFFFVDFMKTKQNKTKTKQNKTKQKKLPFILSYLLFPFFSLPPSPSLSLFLSFSLSLFLSFSLSLFLSFSLSLFLSFSLSLFLSFSLSLFLSFSLSLFLSFPLSLFPSFFLFSCLHPDTKEPIPHLCRFSAFGPANAIMVPFMLAPSTIASPLRTVFGHWTNQRFI